MGNLRLFVAFFFLGVMCVLVGCTETQDMRDAVKTEQLMEEAGRQVGMPGISNWTEKKLMKRIYEMRDQEKLITYTYIVDEMGKMHFLTKSLGYGLPYATQFSNPERIAHFGGGYNSMPQAEPNGLFMPPQAEATWIIAIDEKGNTQPLYVEPRIIVSPFPLASVNN